MIKFLHKTCMNNMRTEVTYTDRFCHVNDLGIRVDHVSGSHHEAVRLSDTRN